MEWFAQKGGAAANNFDKLCEIESINISEQIYELRLKTNDEQTFLYRYQTDGSGFSYAVKDFVKIRSVPSILQEKDYLIVQDNKYTGILKVPKFFKDWAIY